MVSSTTAQLGIVKRAKTPIIPPIIRYKDARPAITAYLTDPAKKLNPLVTAEQMFQHRVADMSESTLRRDAASVTIDPDRLPEGQTTRTVAALAQRCGFLTSGYGETGRHSGLGCHRAIPRQDHAPVPVRDRLPAPLFT